MDKPNTSQRQQHDSSLASAKRVDNNKLFHIANLKQLMKSEWDIDSPRFKLACYKLGINPVTEMVMK